MISLTVNYTWNPTTNATLSHPPALLPGYFVESQIGYSQSQSQLWWPTQSTSIPGANHGVAILANRDITKLAIASLRSWNHFNFELRTSRNRHSTRNFEPDPFLRSRRSRNAQNWPESAFFNKKCIFVEVGPFQNTFNFSQARPWAGPKASQARLGASKGWPSQA